MSKFIHFSELTPTEPDEEPDPEWDTYVREVGRLIAEGHEAKFVLIKGDQILGIWDEELEAEREGYRRYLRGGFLVHQIRTWERVHLNIRLFTHPWLFSR